jgi:predicted DNA-binding transcriptional regulator AlpA
MTNPQILVSAKEASNLLSVSERYFNELRKKEDFPKPRDFGRRNRWVLSELNEWAKNLPKIDFRDEPSQLVGTSKNRHYGANE